MLFVTLQVIPADLPKVVYWKRFTDIPETCYGDIGYFENLMTDTAFPVKGDVVQHVACHNCRSSKSDLLELAHEHFTPKREIRERNALDTLVALADRKFFL